jgi:photosynthetic reaction center cytochrome c subunit
MKKGLYSTMRNPPISIQAFVAASALLFAPVRFVSAQAPQTSGTAVRTAEQQFKNIKVLKTVPADQLVQAMHVINGALGVECEYCHDEADRSMDDKEAKLTARKMMTMMMDINMNSFNGKMEVTCYTCHGGKPKPSVVQPLPVTLAVTEDEPKAAPAMPSVDAILDKYVQALGGEQAIRKITSRVITATQDLPTGAGGVIPVPAQVERYQKAPNLTMSISKTDKITVADGYNGSSAWAQNATGVVADAPNPDGMRIRRSADIYESLNLRNEYSQITVDRIEKVNGHDAYMLTGIPAGDLAERLYFDTQSGLLLRKESVIPSVAGDGPFEVDYDEYRNAGHGVKIPYVVRMFPATSRSHLQTHSTIHVQKVQENVPIDDAKFAKPISQPAVAPPPAPAR